MGDVAGVAAAEAVDEELEVEAETLLIGAAVFSVGRPWRSK